MVNSSEDEVDYEYTEDGEDPPFTREQWKVGPRVKTLTVKLHCKSGESLILKLVSAIVVLQEQLGVALGGRAAQRLAISEGMLWAAAAFSAVAHPEIVLTSIFTTDHPITLADYKLAVRKDL